MSNWSCKSCGETHEPQFDSCWKCGSERFLDQTNGRPQPSDSHSNTKTEPRAEPRAEPITAQITCVKCKTVLRTKLVSGFFQCPECLTKYQSQQVHSSPPAFVISPQLPMPEPYSPPPPKQNKGLTPEVKAALKIFGLDETSDLKAARQAYRKLVQGYHPDKVTHLGPELRNLAESKCKEFNAAIKTIELHFTN